VFKFYLINARILKICLKKGEYVKKVLCLALLFAFSAAPSFAFGLSQNDQEFIIKLGVEPTGTFDGDTSRNTDLGISFGVEYFSYLNNNVIAIGGGAMYELARKVQDTDLKVSYLPIYLAVKARTPLRGMDTNFAYLTGRLGYSVFMPDNSPSGITHSGGLYYAGGAGVCLDVFIIEAIYSVRQSKFETGNVSENINYGTIGIYAGFKFN